MDNDKLRLCLGTVQFGLDYGINNPNGKPPKEKSLEMLKFAYESGIRFFDTAAAYGNAEEILGEFIEKNNLKGKIFITSKLAPNIISENEKDIKGVVENELRKTLAKLHVDKLYGYYLHTPSYVYNKEIMAALQNCKNKGLTENIGVSIYEEKDALYAAELPVDIIQIPYSVFDQRLNKTNFFEIAKKNKIKVFARSAFLQGLLFMEENKIPDYLAEAREYVKDFKKIIGKCGFSPAEASLLFSYNNKAIDGIVFGVDNIDMLKEDIGIAKSGADFSECLKELAGKFENIEKSVIFPSLWKK
ncbi:MAG: aldo/keto reductase [Candidatus Pacebacteria bacterium]|nr:aldo/keto reductase [Candidatus Paceibacterota bacterium]